MALSEVSFELRRGSFTTLIGANGSGKSTLLKLVSGVPAGGSTEGQVRYRGTDFRQLSQLERARQVCYVGAELVSDFPLTALETVMLARICQAGVSDERIRSVMEECRCWELRDRELHSLSGGERQRVALAKAFAQGAGVLLLDEALSRMDLNHQAAIGQVLSARARATGQVILLVSHDLNVASEWAADAILLHEGRKVADGRINAVLTQGNLRKLYPDVDFFVSPSPATGAVKVFFGRNDRG